ncbi:actin interacting protein 3-domain-containing protein [Collybia nuda]|uniref:Actin interacting protein 3-domain-containing protein n=1 Tax=Collybia nuda TaxID=64659 RepID=A0A9P5Y625_9AGAR|nr:actin interacting protein 3-domain-containing protein [Collybia nuda]
MTSRSNGVPGHASRRENQSVSSNHSSSGRNERGTRQPTHPAVETTVTRLLVAIKDLLEALTQWSQLRRDENEVSDVYVRLGNDFNAAVAAFAAFNIDMTELMGVPEDLRNVLEQCLAEDATPENLEIYLPTVRQIITNLLQGLRGKQSIFRRIVNEQRRGSDQSSGAHERTESRSSRGERSSRREGGHRSQLSRTIAEHERPERDSMSRRSGQSQSRRRDPISNGDEQFVGGFAPPLPEQSPPLSNHGYPEDSPPTFPEPPTRKSRQAPPSTSEVSQPTQSNPPPAIPVETTPKPPPSSIVPASVKRYPLFDKPTSPPAVLVEPSSPSIDPGSTPSSPAPETPPPELPPAMVNSLAALKKNDVLERRASKRFSTFNISKMTGSTIRERSVRGHPNRRSLAVSSALTPGELAVLTEVDDEEPIMQTTLRRESSARARSISRTATPEQRQNTPSVPPLPPPKTPEPPMIIGANQQIVPEDSSAEPSLGPSRITVFLQLGREVKKATIEPNLSFSSLRVLFVDKFSYNPGKENFPAIYIRDPSSGVQYELEDTDEVKEKCLLSLNIEPLDQIKQHIDTQISTLSNDLKELRTAVTNNSNRPHMPPSFMVEPLAESTPLPTRPTDRQFQHVARRLSRFVGDPSHSHFLAQAPVSTNTSPFVQPQTTGQSLQPQMTGGSILSDYSSRVVTDLKTQFDEVQNLRRDLGIMRQLYTEFMKQTKDSLGTLRTQTQSVKKLAGANVGGARGYIDSGKKKLDVRSQNVLTDVEKLLDTVENVKDDVTKRQITPKEQYVKSIKKDIDSVATELESLKEHIKTIKPMWKKTWEEELQNIVEEQQFLSHQEEFLNDLLEDHKAVVEVYGHIEKIISIRGPGLGSSNKTRQLPRNRSFKPPPLDEGHGGLNTVMMEIRGAAIDPEKRMKAIEASQKNREKELAARSDDLQAELSEFVGGKRLKMTGGADEAERVRQKRNEMTLKAMFTGGSLPGVNSETSSSSGS